MQDKDNILSHCELKKLYRFFLIRQYLHSKNTSGLYSATDVRQAARGTGANIRTVERDIVSLKNVVVVNGNHVCFAKLEGSYKKAHKLFITHRTELQASKTPQLLFADLYKARVIKAGIIAQAHKEADKCNDERNGTKFLRKVKRTTTLFGPLNSNDVPEAIRDARQVSSIRLALSAIARQLGRSKTTVWRYIGRMNDAGIIRVIKNLLRLCHVSELTAQIRKADNLYGRLTVRDFSVYERLQNTYIFLK